MRLTQTFIFLFVFSLSYAQKNITTPQAINLIYKESMLCQRMAKDKIYAIGKTMENTAQKELVSSVVLFEKNLNILKKMSLDKDVHKKVLSIELIWMGYKQAILNKNYNSGINVINYNNIVLGACNDLTNDLVKIAKKHKEFPFNNQKNSFSEAFLNSNEIKNLSQRLALYYVAYFHKVSKYKPSVFNEILLNIDNKISKIITLKNLDVDIAENTEHLEYQWKEIQAILQSVKKSNFISAYNAPKTELIFEECNRLLTNADRLTQTYKSTSSL